MRSYLIILLFVFLGVSASAQSDSVAVLNGKKYCIHTIKSGETLYSLSRLYKVAFSKIKAANPTIGDALSIGDLVKVPCDDAIVSSKKTTPVVPDEFKGNYIFHVVRKGETIFAIKQEYGVTEDQLFKDNPSVKEQGLKIGETIKILKKEMQTADEVVVERFLDSNRTFLDKTEKIDSVVLQDTSIVRVGLFLPFQYEENAKFMKKNKEDEVPELRLKTKIFVEFYEGALMAIDSLRNLGMNIQVFPYDTHADTNRTKELLKRKEVKMLDLVIGPVYTKNFLVAAKTFKPLGIPMVSPLTKSNKVLENNPFAIKVMPSLESHAKSIARYVYKTRPNDKIVVVYDKAPDKELALKVQSEILTLSLMKDTGALKKIHIAKGVYEPLGLLSKDTATSVIVLNDKESFSSKFVTHLYSRADSNVTVFGLENWPNFRNIEIDYWNKLNIHISSTTEYRFGVPMTNAFAKKYFQTYFTEPSKYALSGYDLTFIFLNSLRANQNKYSHSNIVGKYFMGGIRDYQFKYTGTQNGIDNKAVSIFKFHDYKLIRVNDY